MGRWALAPLDDTALHALQGLQRKVVSLFSHHTLRQDRIELLFDSGPIDESRVRLQVYRS
jgi:hypothetical protein